jgi:hypothetical protein
MSWSFRTVILSYRGLDQPANAAANSAVSCLLRSRAACAQFPLLPWGEDLQRTDVIAHALHERQVLYVIRCSTPHFPRWVAKGAAFASAAAITLSGLPRSSRLTVANLEGSWSGKGTVSFADG